MQKEVDRMKVTIKMQARKIDSKDKCRWLSTR